MKFAFDGIFDPDTEASFLEGMRACVKMEPATSKSIPVSRPRFVHRQSAILRRYKEARKIPCGCISASDIRPRHREPLSAFSRVYWHVKPPPRRININEVYKQER